MFPFRKPLESLTAEDIEAIAGFPESTTLEFKQIDYQDRERDKTELCKDVSGMANAQGGYIICGFDDDGNLVGLGPDYKEDEKIKKFEQVLLGNITPRIHGVRMRVVALSDSQKGCVLVIQVPRSLSAPHRASEQGAFFMRREKSVMPMTMDELRRAFNFSETYIQRVQAFRRDRVSKVSNEVLEEMPVILQSEPKLMVHLIPIGNSIGQNAIDLKNVANSMPAHGDEAIHFKHRNRYNLYGVATAPSDSKSQRQYIQVFREGTVEFVCIVPFEEKSLASIGYIERMVGYFTAIGLSTLKRLGVATPLSLGISLLGFKGAVLFYGSSLPPMIVMEEIPPISHSIIMSPDILIEDYPSNVAPTIKPALDFLANAAGYAQSRGFDQSGNWRYGKHLVELADQS